jgi:hypothetical protein
MPACKNRQEETQGFPVKFACVPHGELLMRFQAVFVAVLLSLPATAGAQGTAGVADSEVPSPASGPAPVVFVSIFGSDATALRAFSDCSGIRPAIPWHLSSSARMARPRFLDHVPRLPR